jgi:hypothetical protein
MHRGQPAEQQFGPRLERYLLAMSYWQGFMAASREVGNHWWWRLSLITVMPAYGVTHLVPAFNGLPRAVTGWLWFVVILALWADMAISYYRYQRMSSASSADQNPIEKADW